MRKYYTFDIFNMIFLGLLSITFVIPFIFVINHSIMNNDDIIMYGFTIFPKSINLDAYRYLLFESSFVLRGYSVSIFVTVVGTLLNLVFTSLLAYGLSKKFLPYRNVFNFLIFFTMLFGGGLIPTFILVISMGMVDSLWALIIPALVSPWNMFILRNFFSKIPESLEESAVVDGAGYLTILIRIVLPLSLPALATIGLFYAVAHWNSWFAASIYINQPKLWPLQLVLRNIVNTLDYEMLDPDVLRNMPKESTKAATTILTALPIICLYPFIQKYFVTGLMIGAVKE